MQIEEQTREAALVVSPVGRLDGAGATELEAHMAAVLARGDARLVLDCAGVAYINSAGMRALFLCAKICHAAGGRLVIAALRANCLSIVEASGLLTILEYRRTSEAAVSASARAAAGANVGWQSPPGNSAAMKVEARCVGSLAVLSLIGRLDRDGAERLEAGVSANVGRGTARIVLDCSRLAYVNSLGLRAVLVCARMCSDEGGKLTFAALQPECRSLLEMSGFLKVIDHHATIEAALAALA